MVHRHEIAAFTLFPLLLCARLAQAQEAGTEFKFDFRAGPAAPGYTHVAADTLYSKQSGHGFDLGTKPGPQPFFFSVAVAEGTYKVTLILGDAESPTTTTVKAESRRLMLERVHTGAGEFVTRSFTVNIRVPRISTGGQVKLDSREQNALHWDEKLTLEISDEHPGLCAMEIQRVEAITVFTIGDSTVTDQGSEPGGSWAQNLPRWFTPRVAIANHAESGETLKAFRAERRWDKVLSLLKPGDYVFMQFGTNDMKKRGVNPIYPDGDFSKTYAEANSEFKALLERYAGDVKERGGTPVIVSPMARWTLRDGKSVNTLGDYPRAAGAAAKEFGCPFIDLNGLSAQVYEALGEGLVRRAFVDQTHNSTYGGYLLSRCIVEGIKRDKLDLAEYLVEDAGTFDPAHPEPMPGDFKIPADPGGRGRGAGRRGRGVNRATTLPQG